MLAFSDIHSLEGKLRMTIRVLDLSIPSRDQNITALLMSSVKYCQCANLQRLGQLKCLSGELPAWTCDVSVPLDGMSKAIFPRLFPPPDN